MTKKEIKIARKNMEKIREYRIVLSKLMKYPISMEQAMADWLEHEYDNQLVSNNALDSGALKN